MGEVSRGHIEVRALRAQDKWRDHKNSSTHCGIPQGEKEPKGWDDYKKLPEEIPEFPLIRRMLLGAVSAVQTPRLRAFETNKRRMAKFSETMDPCFVGRNAAVLQHTHFAYTDQATRRRISNAATPKPARFDEEWAKLDLRAILKTKNKDSSWNHQGAEG